MVSCGFPVPTKEKLTRAAHGEATFWAWRGAKQKSREMQKILQLMQQYEVGMMGERCHCDVSESGFGLGNNLGWENWDSLHRKS